MDDIQVECVGDSKWIPPIRLPGSLLAQIEGENQGVQSENDGIEAGILSWIAVPMIAIFL